MLFEKKPTFKFHSLKKIFKITCCCKDHTQINKLENRDDANTLDGRNNEK